MLSNDVLRQLIDDRRHERERDAQEERLAVQARARRHGRDITDASGPGIGLLQLLAARHHATP